MARSVDHLKSIKHVYIVRNMLVLLWSTKFDVFVVPTPRSVSSCTFVVRFLFEENTSSSCCATGTDIPDPLSPLLTIVHRLWWIFRATSSHSCCMYVRAGRPAFTRAYVGVPQVYITYELVPASPAVTCMSGSSDLDSLRDGRRVVV